jgi:integrase
MALHLSGVVFRRPWEPPRLKPWEGLFADPTQRLGRRHRTRTAQSLEIAKTAIAVAPPFALRSRSRRVTIANVHEMTLADAKDKARKLLLDMRGGKDPKAKPSTGTLQETLDLYLESARLSPRSKSAYASLVRIQLATLQHRLLGSITPDEVDRLHRSIVGRSVANAAIKCFRMLYRWAAERDDELPRNPVRLRKGEWFKTEPRRNPIPFESLSNFYNAVMQLPPMGRDYILLLLFTGLRKNEAAGLRWSEVDFERRLICLPQARIKTRSALDLPMVDFVADILIARRQLGDADYVFPSRETYIRGDAWTKTLRKSTNIQFTIHDLRRTYATVAESCDIPFPPKATIQQSCPAGPSWAKTGCEQVQQRAHYSINSSAAASSAGGTVRPSAFAVLRFTAVSNLVPACTGRLPGLSPRRMRST